MGYVNTIRCNVIDRSQIPIHEDDCEHVEGGGTYHGSILLQTDYLHDDEGHVANQWFDVYTYTDKSYGLGCCFRHGRQGDYYSPAAIEHAVESASSGENPLYLECIRVINEKLLSPTVLKYHRCRYQREEVQ